MIDPFHEAMTPPPLTHQPHPLARLAWSQRLNSVTSLLLPSAPLPLLLLCCRRCRCFCCCCCGSNYALEKANGIVENITRELFKETLLEQAEQVSSLAVGLSLNLPALS